MAFLKRKHKPLYFLVHGYTGSPTDFNGLPRHITEITGAEVVSPLLPGHGTRVEDLDNITYKDFLASVEKEFARHYSPDRKIIIGGISFGAQLALNLAAKYSVSGVFNVCAPSKMRFPFNIPGIRLIAPHFKYWKKHYKEYEIMLRTNAIYYDVMHSYGLLVTADANKDLQRLLPEITTPILTIHTKGDRICSHKSAREIMGKVASRKHKTLLFRDRHHNVFFSPARHYAYKEIVDFFSDDR